MKTRLSTLIGLNICAGVVLTSSTCYAAGASVSFKNLADGTHVSSPVKVEMGIDGMKLVPAGEVSPGEGHHHLIIDGGAVPEGQVVPADATHLHFGKAQTEAEISLPAGKHTLTLQFADGLHRSFGPALSKTISVVVDAVKPSEK